MSRDSVEALKRHTQACGFASADIVALSKRMAEGTAPPPPTAGDAAALKVEKNALALVFIPEMMSAAQDVAEAYPHRMFTLLHGELGVVDATLVARSCRAVNGEALRCAAIYASLQNLFTHLGGAYMARLAADPLAGRYARALGDYHGHTQVSSRHFTPQGHLLAGINTALFFLLRALSAFRVLGARTLGRPVAADELATGMANATPLLLTIARCHLEQLLVLEEPLGKQQDLFLTQLDADAYGAALAEMFTVEHGPAGLKLELAEAIRAGLPKLSSDKPRTGCPALYASTHDNTNAIVALLRITLRAYLELAEADLALAA